MLTRDDNETYVIKLSNNPYDFLLFPLAISSNVVMAIFYENTTEIMTPEIIFLLVLIMMGTDLIFGCLHHFCHNNPYMRKLHMVHHEYRKEDLNTFANFYSEFTDALIMTISGWYDIILIFMLSMGTLPFKEVMMVVGQSHHKYANHHMSLYYFFEFELIDMIMDRVRFSSFHNEHHTHLDKNFGIYGVISDEVVIKVNQYIKNGYQSVVRASQLYKCVKKGLSY